eukprot:CAMPEP_0194032442 /NCGR_PEP_ID=MMETSP0009_2-20130614/5381_1 /TAXON_ID=210454 /ORGANISM="Grammatophora oceanica, Strain CCMP 410" /LENGTH=53 /DNA_ID=CAMNT_0038672887 /DNA_START=87 /DNA_END=245 /DNA_ORIENTATION=-
MVSIIMVSNTQNSECSEFKMSSHRPREYEYEYEYEEEVNWMVSGKLYTVRRNT